MQILYFSNETKTKINFDIENIFLTLANKTFKLLNINPKPFSVTIVSKRTIKKINKEYRNKNNVTDVISFSFVENNTDQFLLGDIYICIKRAIKQSEKYNHSIKRELSFLFVHGLLHILGFDHENKKDEKIMFDYQNKILESCKIYR